MKLFCSTKEPIYQTLDVQNICSNPLKFILSKLDSEDDLSHFWDPHNCSGSCAWPDYGCKACANPEYFHCKKDNVSVCMHPELECDGHPQCDNSEDEDIDRCFHRYVELGIVTNYATLKCTSVMYPQMITLATVCDGIVECQNDADELPNCQKRIPFWINLFIIAIISLHVFLEIKRICKHSNIEEELNLRTKYNFSDFAKKYSENHEKFCKMINFHLMFIKFTKDKKTKSKEAISFYIYEEQNHKKNDAEIHCCIHNNLDPNVCEMIIDHNFPGFMEKHFSSITSFLDKLKRNKKYRTMQYYFSKLGGLFGHYSDLIKDTYIFITMYTLNGGVKPLIDFPTNFTSVIVFSFGASIVVPLLMASIHLAKNNHQIVYRGWKLKLTKTKCFIMKLGVIIFSFLNPVIIMNSYENFKEMARLKAEQLESKCLSRKVKLLYQIKLQFVEFLSIDLTLECVYQLFGQIILLFLSKTQTLTTGGLDIFFNEDVDYVLILSIIWSLKSIISLHLKTIATEKGFLPFTAKITILLWGTMANTKRILSMVTFFIPSLGLFDILCHWQAEQLPFYVRKSSLRKGAFDTLELYNMTEKVLWTDIDRYNYESSTPPPYTLYTGLSLGQSFITFIGIFVVHFLCILLLKSFTVDHFWMKNHYNKFVHILTNMNIATPWRDWDYDKCSVEQHKIKHRKVNIEMALIMLVNMVISLFMLCPLFYTGN